MGPVSDEVVGPDVIRPFGPETDAGSVIQPEAASLRLLGWDLKPLTPPEPLNTLLVDRPAHPTKHRRDAAITVAPILAGQLGHVRDQCRFIVGCLRGLALRGAMLAQDTAGAPFRHAQCLDRVIHASPAARGA